MTIEQRNYGDSRSRLKLETRADGTQSLTGYAAVFYDGTPATQFSLWSGCVERIMPGAFDAALERGDDVRCLFNHQPSSIFGRTLAGTLTLTVDTIGLRYDCLLSETPEAKSLADSIARRDVSGSSFGFDQTTSNWITDKTSDGVQIDVREVISCQLWDVGPATFPAYAGTSTEIAERSLNSFRNTERAQLETRRLVAQRLLQRAIAAHP